MTVKEFVYNALKVKFKAKGRSYSSWDCYGLMYMFYRDVLEVELPSFADDYVDAGDSKASRRVLNDMILAQKHNWKRVEVPQACDVVLFRFGDTYTHLGVMVNRFSFIHCEKKINTVIERIDSMKWKMRVEGFYRLKDRI